MRIRNIIFGCSVALLAVVVYKATAQDEKAEQLKQLSKLSDQVRFSYSNGDYVKAHADVTKICEITPDNVSFQSYRGDISFAAGEFADSVDAYDQVIRLNPEAEPRLWQRGLSLYYADRFADGVKQFETHQTVNSQDVENAVWHLLCAARVSDVEAARKKLIPITDDTRVPMSQVYEMFAGRMTPADVLAKASKSTERAPTGTQQHKLQLYYAHLYTGLYHEMLKQPELAIASLKKAVEVNPLEKTNFMGQVARVHLQQRGVKE